MKDIPITLTPDMLKAQEFLDKTDAELTKGIQEVAMEYLQHELVTHAYQEDREERTMTDVLSSKGVRDASRIR